jgi:hypothetical protein
MANGGIIGPVQTPVINPPVTQPETITGVTSPNPAFAVQPATTQVTVMVIAGGAAGGVGGGGAGGLRIISNHPVPSSPFPITIGAGGTRGPAANAATNSPGSNSTFGAASPIASTGGGGSLNSSGPGLDGGSGGGASGFGSGGAGK